MKKLTLLFVVLMFFNACNESHEKIKKEIESTVMEGIESISKNPNLPLDEVKKLSQLEYKSITLPIDSSPQEIQVMLNTLGKERWDCHSIFPRPRTAPDKPEILFVCKRPPETVLKYLPGAILGKR